MHPWFSQVGGERWVIDNTGYPARYLLHRQGDADALLRQFDDLQRQKRQVGELRSFFAHLTEQQCDGPTWPPRDRFSVRVSPCRGRRCLLPTPAALADFHIPIAEASSAGPHSHEP